MKNSNEIIHVGIAEALAEINRRNQPPAQPISGDVILLDLSRETGSWPPLPGIVLNAQPA
jgi:hypothetical protein